MVSDQDSRPVVPDCETFGSAAAYHGYSEVEGLGLQNDESKTEDEKVDNGLKWRAINNIYEWGKLNGVDDGDGENDLVGDMAKKLESGGTELKEDNLGSENKLNRGDVISLPNNFGWKKEIYKGEDEFFVDAADSGAIEFEVVGVEYDYYIIKAVDGDEANKKWSSASGSQGRYSSIYMPKYLVSEENPNVPINWRSLVIKEKE